MPPIRCNRNIATNFDMFVQRYLYLISILFLNPLSLTRASNIYDAIISSFEEDGSKVFCVLMLTSETQAFTSNKLPVLAVNISDAKVDLRKSPCKNYVIALRNLEDIIQLYKRQLRVMISYFLQDFLFYINFILDSLETQNLQLSFKKRLL